MEDGDGTWVPAEERRSVPLEPTFWGRSEEGSSGSGSGTQSRRRRGRERRPPELGCHFRVSQEANVEVPGWSGLVGAHRRAGSVASESGGVPDA